MYDTEFRICEDPEINDIYERYVQSQMLAALRNVIRDAGVIAKFEKEEPLVGSDIAQLHMSADDFFPEWFDRDEIPDTMRELYSIIASDDRYIPSVVEEYVLASAIEDMADYIRDGGGELITEPMPERNRVVEALTQLFVDEAGDDRQEAGEAAEERIRGIENFSGIVENCFYDMDFGLLDDFSQEDVVMSGMDNECGIGVMEPARKRLPDGTLEYIGKPMERDSFTITVKL